jgi:hypothetical protein
MSLHLSVILFTLLFDNAINHDECLQVPLSHRIVVIPPLCTSFYRHYISSSRKANKYERHNIGMSLKAYLKQHLVLLGNIILNEEYEITLLKCNNA